MKKLFLACMLFVSSFGLHAAGVYTPTAGPVQLGDAGNGQQGVARGAIMKAVIDNNPANQNTNPTLAAANAAIANFDGQGQFFRSYQTIVANIAQSTKSQAAVDAVKAFESVIMYLYDYDIYFCGGYKPGTSIFVTGVRWSWFNPLSFLSLKSYFSDNDARAKQLIDELDNLANAVKIHSGIEYARIKATVHSYRHWRKNMMLLLIAYLGADAYKHGYENSLVNQFYQGGFSNAGEMMINHMMNCGSGLHYVGKGLNYGAQGIWKAGRFVGNVALYGKKAFENQSESLNNNAKETKVEQKAAPAQQARVKCKTVQSMQTTSALSSNQDVSQKSLWQHWKSYCATFPKSCFENGSASEVKECLQPVVVQVPKKKINVVPMATAQLDFLIQEDKQSGQKREDIKRTINAVINSLSGQDIKNLNQTRDGLLFQMCQTTKSGLKNAADSVQNSFHQAVYDARTEVKSRKFWQSRFESGNKFSEF